MANYYLTVTPVDALSTSTYSVYFDEITPSNLMLSGVPLSTLSAGLLVYFTGSAASATSVLVRNEDPDCCCAVQSYIFPTPSPTTAPTTAAPTTAAPTTAAPTPNPTTASPTPNPTTAAPTTAAPTTPSPTAALTACHAATFGIVPVSGGAGSYATGNITVTGGSVNVWAIYYAAGNNSGTAQFSMTINSISASGTFTITSFGQQGYTNTGGTAAGYITLSPGTYSFSLVKSDNETAGANVTFTYADSSITDPTLSFNMSTC